MQRATILICLVCLVVAPNGAFGQGDDSPLQPLRVCTAMELEVISGYLDVFLQDYTMLFSGVSPTLDTALAFIAMLNVMQVGWWSDIAAVMPRCSTGVVAMQLVGRTIDETLIAVLLILAGQPEVADAHTDTGIVLWGEVIALHELLTADVGVG